MSKSVALLFVIVLLAASGVLIIPIKADSRTIIVPDDYPEIATALNNALDGDTVFIKNGTYEGPIDQTLVIDKSLSLVGENAKSTIINLHPAYNVTWIITQPFYSVSDAIAIDASDVRLLNLTLMFMGDIRVSGCRVQIIGNSITSRSTATGLIITGSECNVTNNVILGRINLGGSSNVISQNSLYSLILQSSDENIIDSNGLKYLQLYSSNNNTISRNSISYENVQYVMDIRNSTNNVFHGNRIANLRLGFQAQNNTFYGNAFFGEYELVSTDTTAFGNFWDNGLYGNFWSNYNGTDVFGDGIGDVPYIIDGNNQDRYPLMKPLSAGEAFERPFPTTLVVALAVTLAVIVVGFLVYFKKRKH